MYFDISSKFRILSVLLCIFQENFCLWLKYSHRRAVPSPFLSFLPDHFFLLIPPNLLQAHIIALVVGRSGGSFRFTIHYLFSALKKHCRQNNVLQRTKTQCHSYKQSKRK